MTTDDATKFSSDNGNQGVPKAKTEVAVVDEHNSLKYHLLGPSLTKAGQDAVDQQKVCFSLLVADLLFSGIY